jgi:membrane protease YdiL (CAAX protease family)
MQVQPSEIPQSTQAEGAQIAGYGTDGHIPGAAPHPSMAVLILLILLGLLLGETLRLLLLLLVLRWRGFRRRDFLQRLPSIRSAFTAALIGLQFMLLASGTGWVAWCIWLELAPRSLLEMVARAEYPPPERLVFFIWVTLAASIFEEFLFRGLLLPRAVSRWGPLRGCLVVSVFFAVFHVDTVTAFAASMILSLMYIARGEIVSPIIFHVVINLAIDVIHRHLVFWNLAGKSPEENLRQALSYYPFMLMCLFLGSVLMLSRVRAMLTQMRLRADFPPRQHP